MYCFFADCNFSHLKVGTIPFTNWGITSNVFEPVSEKSKKCVKMCVDSSNADCNGQWKVGDCSTQLNFVCQTPCNIENLV